MYTVRLAPAKKVNLTCTVEKGNLKSLKQYIDYCLKYRACTFKPMLLPMSFACDFLPGLNFCLLACYCGTLPEDLCIATLC
jgi:hypothetical protein